MKQILSAAQYRALNSKKSIASKGLKEKASKVKREEWKGIEPREVNYVEDLENLTEGERKLKEL